jgi:hypothetical protein
MYAQPTLNGAPSAPASYSNLSTFGATSVRIIPIPSTYESGYLPGQGFPAENENYLMYNTTLSINAIANDVSNIHAEILTILTGQSITPDGTTGQLNTAISNKIISTVTGSVIATALQAYGGNVGIGKSPSYTLDVNGNINGTDLYIAGTSVTVSLNLKAPLASPTFTGTVVVPVASGTTSPTQKTYVDTQDSALQTSINGKQPLAITASGIGQLVSINAANTYTLPSGGTWMYFYVAFSSATGGATGVTASSIANGGTNIASAASTTFIGFAWRIS